MACGLGPTRWRPILTQHVSSSLGHLSLLALAPVRTTHTHSLGLGKQTTSQLQAFRKRADDAKRSLALLQSQSADVDLAHYRGVLKVSRLCLA